MLKPTEEKRVLPTLQTSEGATPLSEVTILTFLGTYLPGYKAGGPLRSIENLVAAIGEEFQFKIVTLDRDIGERVPFPGIAVNQWVRVGHADVMYVQPGYRGL